jgi:hypothetical protein
MFPVSVSVAVAVAHRFGPAMMTVQRRTALSVPPSSEVRCCTVHPPLVTPYFPALCSNHHQPYCCWLQTTSLVRPCIMTCVPSMSPGSLNIMQHTSFVYCSSLHRPPYTRGPLLSLSPPPPLRPRCRRCTVG